MEAFLLALADLMEAHDVDSIEAVDDGAEYYPSVDGVEVRMRTRWDAAENETRDKCVLKIMRDFGAKDLRKLVQLNDK
jgi:hypothetical protein